MLLLIINNNIVLKSLLAQLGLELDLVTSPDYLWFRPLFILFHFFKR